MAEAAVMAAMVVAMCTFSPLFLLLAHHSNIILEIFIPSWGDPVDPSVVRDEGEEILNKRIIIHVVSEIGSGGRSHL